MTTDVISENTSEQNGTSDGGGPYTGIVDTVLWASLPTTNDVTGNILRVRNHTGSAEARAPISFDTGLANISGPVTVTNATLYVYVQGQSGTEDFTVTAYDVLQSMVFAEATWNIYSTGNNWGTSGAKSSGTDYAATALGSGNTGTGAAGYWVAITGSALDQAVEDQINGSRSSLDILLARTDAAGGARKDFTSEDNTSYQTQRPELVVVYTAGSASVVPKVQHHARRRR